MKIRERLAKIPPEGRCTDEGLDRACQKGKLGRMEPDEWAEACFGVRPEQETEEQGG